MSLLERSISSNCWNYRHYSCKGVRTDDHKEFKKCECSCHNEM